MSGSGSRSTTTTTWRKWTINEDQFRTNCLMLIYTCAWQIIFQQQTRKYGNKPEHSNGIVCPYPGWLCKSGPGLGMAFNADLVCLSLSCGRQTNPNCCKREEKSVNQLNRVSQATTATATTTTTTYLTFIKIQEPVWNIIAIFMYFAGKEV